MPDRKIKLDLTKIPFGRARSKVMVYEENSCDGEEFKPGLFFVMMNQGAAARRKGLVDLVPMYDGKPLEYTYEATPSKLLMTTEKGTVSVVIDTDDTMRIVGKGVGIKLYTKIPFMAMETATMLPGGLADLNLMSYRGDGGRFMFKALKGSITLESVFNPTINGPEDAKVEFFPDEDGEFDIITYFMHPDEWGYIDPKPVDDCVAAIEAEFEAFANGYPAVDEKWAELKDLCAYAVWLHSMSPSKIELIPTMKSDMIYANCLTGAWANTYQQALHALAMDDADKALAYIEGVYAHLANGMLAASVSPAKTHYQAVPPVFGLAVKNILAKGDICAERAKKLYDLMKENYEWWKKGHSFGEGRFSYNHRDELAVAGISYSTLEFPLETPDLYALMALYAEALAMLSAIVGDGKEGEWKAAEKATIDGLMTLWNGEAFNCKAAVSGEIFKTESLLAYLPVVLGDKLPADVIVKMTKALADEDKFFSAIGLRSESKQSKYFDASVEGRGAIVMWLQQIIICGLFECDADLAKKVAENILAGVQTNGVRDVLASEGEQAIARPGDYINATAASAVLYIAGKLSN